MAQLDVLEIWTTDGPPLMRDDEGNPSVTTPYVTGNNPLYGFDAEFENGGTLNTHTTLKAAVEAAMIYITNNPTHMVRVWANDEDATGCLMPLLDSHHIHVTARSGTTTVLRSLGTNGSSERNHATPGVIWNCHDIVIDPNIHFTCAESENHPGYGFRQDDAAAGLKISDSSWGIWLRGGMIGPTGTQGLQVAANQGPNARSAKSPDYVCVDNYEIFDTMRSNRFNGSAVMALGIGTTGGGMFNKDNRQDRYHIVYRNCVSRDTTEGVLDNTTPGGAPGGQQAYGGLCTDHNGWIIDAACPFPFTGDYQYEGHILFLNCMALRNAGRGFHILRNHHNSGLFGVDFINCDSIQNLTALGEQGFYDDSSLGEFNFENSECGNMMNCVTRARRSTIKSVRRVKYGSWNGAIYRQGSTHGRHSSAHDLPNAAGGVQDQVNLGAGLANTGVDTNGNPQAGGPLVDGGTETYTNSNTGRTLTLLSRANLDFDGNPGILDGTTGAGVSCTRVVDIGAKEIQGEACNDDGPGFNFLANGFTCHGQTTTSINVRFSTDVAVPTGEISIARSTSPNGPWPGPNVASAIAGGALVGHFFNFVGLDPNSTHYFYAFEAADPTNNTGTPSSNSCTTDDIVVPPSTTKIVIEAGG